MRVFVTGATGFIGSRVVPDLMAAGHQVLGLTRSDEGAKSLRAAGAEAHRGDLHDLDSLRRGAAESDGVIHTAFIHDFSRQDMASFKENCEVDRRVIRAIGSVLAGSDRPFVITSGTGTAGGGNGHVATENDRHATGPNALPRVATEEAADEIATLGVCTSIVRLPQVHDTFKQGLITPMIAMVRAKGLAAYINEGRNRWPAAHVNDVAPVYRLALEKNEAGSRYHAVGEEGVTCREIAEVIGRGLNIPVRSLSNEEALAHYGWFGHFVAADMPASSALTQQLLGWRPTGPGLLADLENMRFSIAA